MKKMKKLCVVLAGIAAAAGTVSGASAEEKVQYIRTDSFDTDRAYPRSWIIGSAEELRSYREANEALYNFTGGSSSSIAFCEAITRYDDAFFEGSALLFVLQKASSGSYRYRVESLEFDGGVTSVSIAKSAPRYCRCDMAFWHIIIEADREALLGNPEIRITEASPLGE